LAEFTAEKVRLSEAGFGVPTVVQSCSNNDKMRKAAQIFLKALGYYGYSCTEFKKDTRDGIYKLLEVNGRFNRSGLLSVKCGLNFPWILYNHLINGVIPDSVANYQSKIFWIDEFKDLSTILSYLLKNRFSMIRFLQPYLKKKIFAVFDISDPLPFIKRFFDMFKKLYQKIISDFHLQQAKLNWSYKK
jgi:predicted ATP-grasp superfamily ATP-dependent carboligase